MESCGRFSGKLPRYIQSTALVPWGEFTYLRSDHLNFMEKVEDGMIFQIKSPGLDFVKYIQDRVLSL